MNEQNNTNCKICGDETHGSEEIACDHCGNAIEQFCPPCSVLVHTIDFNSWGLHDNPARFLQGLANYCLEIRDLEIHDPIQSDDFGDGSDKE